MEKKIIITVAVTGSRPTKEMNPAVPYTPKEIVDAAVECHKAGAAIAHVHVRNQKTGIRSLRCRPYLSSMKNKLPPDALWSVLGVGRAQLPMITMAMLLEGNVRVGFEDNIYFKKGVLASSNAQIVEMAVDLSQRLGGEVATPAEARRILGIKYVG